MGGEIGMRLIVWLGLLGLAMTAVAVETEPDPVDWLRSMRQAVSTRSFQGHVTYIKDQKVDTFRLFHAQVDGVDREHLISTSSPLREVVRVGRTVSRYAQDAQQVAVEVRPMDQSLLMALPEDPKVLERYYQFSLRGREYVAGLLTQVVALEPRDPYRYSRLFWIDVATRLPLKLDVLNEDGQSVEQVLFTALNARDPVPLKDLEPTLRGSQPITQISHREPQALKDLRWTLTKVPDGFQIVALTTLKKPQSDSAVDQILLSDGFSAVSIYIEPKDNRAATGPRRMGAVNVEVLTRGDHLVTVMGEVPMPTIQLIGKGFSEKTHP